MSAPSTHFIEQCRRRCRLRIRNCIDCLLGGIGLAQADSFRRRSRRLTRALPAEALDRVDKARADNHKRLEEEADSTAGDNNTGLSILIQNQVRLPLEKSRSLIGNSHYAESFGSKRHSNE